MNITDGQRQAMFEEIQQEMMDECEGKNEGDICQIDNPRGDVNGSCEIRDDILICFSNRTIGPRRE